MINFKQLPIFLFLFFLLIYISYSYYNYMNRQDEIIEGQRQAEERDRQILENQRKHNQMHHSRPRNQYEP